jgi:dipeptidyl aminopeptidase/acylaminoacyl peptidase
VTEKRLRELLRAGPPPGELDAERRAWQVVAAAFAEREPVARPRRHTRALALGIAALAVLAAAVSPPGSAVLDSIRDAVGREREVGVERAGPLLLELPAPGRLLVTSPSGAWVVNADGSKRLLGEADDATWSPQGLFLAAARGRELVALTPEGLTRWTIPQRARVREPRWAPSGFRIAYLAGSTLRVTAGDGTGDRGLARGVPRIAPAWRPGAAHVLAYATGDGSVRIVDTDSDRVLARVRSGGGPVLDLAWTASGRVLAVLDRDGVRIVDPEGATRRLSLLGRTGVSFAAAPRGEALAVVARSPRGSRSEVVILRPGSGVVRSIFTGAGRFSEAVWSPDGRWLLVAWASADQWVFVRSADVEGLAAVADVSRQFRGSAAAEDGFPRIGGWCCG